MINIVEDYHRFLTKAGILTMFGTLICVCDIRSASTLATVETNANLTVDLVLQPDALRMGETPRFILAITNKTASAQRILDLRGRADLQHAYAKLVVTHNGQEVDLPAKISDPGFIFATNWIRLEPSAYLYFAFTSSKQFHELRPGKYEVHVAYRPDGFRSSRQIISPRNTLTVIPLRKK